MPAFPTGTTAVVFAAWTCVPETPADVTLQLWDGCPAANWTLGSARAVGGNASSVDHLLARMAAAACRGVGGVVGDVVVDEALVSGWYTVAALGDRDGEDVTLHWQVLGLDGDLQAVAILDPSPSPVASSSLSATVSPSVTPVPSPIYTPAPSVPPYNRCPCGSYGTNCATTVPVLPVSRDRAVWPWVLTSWRGWVSGHGTVAMGVDSASL